MDKKKRIIKIVGYFMLYSTYVVQATIRLMELNKHQNVDFTIFMIWVFIFSFIIVMILIGINIIFYLFVVKKILNVNIDNVKIIKISLNAFVIYRILDILTSVILCHFFAINITICKGIADIITLVIIFKIVQKYYDLKIKEISKGRKCAALCCCILKCFF